MLQTLLQRTAVDINAVAFAPIESAAPGSGDDGGVVLHCVNSHGAMFEASTFGTVSNMHMFNAGDGGGQRSTTSGRGWHVCADSQASLLVSSPHTTLIIAAATVARHFCYGLPAALCVV